MSNETDANGTQQRAPTSETIDAPNVDVIMDDRVVPIPAGFAADDDTLRAALSPHCPWIANARLDRKSEFKNGVRRTTVTAVKIGGPKGAGATQQTHECSAGGRLLHRLPARMNAAIALSHAIEQAERRGELDAGALLLLAPRIKRAQRRGQEDAQLAGSLRACARGLPAVAARRVPQGF